MSDLLEWLTNPGVILLITLLGGGCVTLTVWYWKHDVTQHPKPSMNKLSRDVASLIQAVSGASMLGTALLNKQAELYQAESHNPHILHITEMDAVERAEQNYQTAIQELSQQRDLANPTLHPILDNFLGVSNASVSDDAGNNMKLQGLLLQCKDETIQKLRGYSDVGEHSHA